MHSMYALWLLSASGWFEVVYRCYGLTIKSDFSPNTYKMKGEMKKNGIRVKTKKMKFLEGTNMDCNLKKIVCVRK